MNVLQMREYSCCSSRQRTRGLEFAYQTVMSSQAEASGNGTQI